MREPGRTAAAEDDTDGCAGNTAREAAHARGITYVVMRTHVARRKPAFGLVREPVPEQHEFGLDVIAKRLLGPREIGSSITMSDEQDEVGLADAPLRPFARIFITDIQDEPVVDLQTVQLRDERSVPLGDRRRIDAGNRSERTERLREVGDEAAEADLVGPRRKDRDGSGCG